METGNGLHAFHFLHHVILGTLLLYVIPATLPLHVIPATLPLHVIPATLPLYVIPGMLPLHVIPGLTGNLTFTLSHPASSLVVALVIPGMLPLYVIPGMLPLHVIPGLTGNLYSTQFLPRLDSRTESGVTEVFRLPPAAPYKCPPDICSPLATFRSRALCPVISKSRSD